MKKIVFLVLVLLFGFNTLFAETRMLESSDFFYMIDDEEQQKDFSGFDDLNIISILMYYAPKTFLGKDLRFYKSTIYNKSFELTDKYYNVWSFDKNETLLTIFENLGDGRYAEIVFLMKDE